MSGETKLEVLKGVLDGVQEQIRFADAKAGFVAVFHTFLFSFIISQAEGLAKMSAGEHDGMYWLRMVLLGLYATATLVSMIYAKRAVMPKFGEKAPDCKIFFGHIVRCYRRDYDRYIADATSATESDWLRDMATQIVENSNIANDKHRNARTATRWSVAAVTLALLLMTMLFFAPATGIDSPKANAAPSTSSIATS